MAEPSTIRLENFKYDLPDSYIARYPLRDRSASRLLLYQGGIITQDRFSNLPAQLPEGSWLVFNDTRVIQARLKFRKESGALIEIFCLEPIDPSDYEMAFQAESPVTWNCLVGNVKKWKNGVVTLKAHVKGVDVVLEAFLKEKRRDGFAIMFRWDHPGVTFGELIEHSGSTPIPPYLRRDAEESDRERYQTVYGIKKGSVAAPTAGLHFTGEMIKHLEQLRIRLSHVTLHVGAGTFVPVKEENARNHSMHSEHVVIKRSFLNQWIKKSDGLIAVGTTSTRSLESLYWLGVKIKEHSLTDPSSLTIVQWENETLPQGTPLIESLQTLIRFCDLHRLDQIHFSTQLMIVPGYRFRTISGLITNFHMPGSTLLLLIAAFIGDDWKKVYSYALEEKFRFLSYGDSSLLFPRSEK
jgi:S-adenosylmethionine:tRNA ribosyltransferase-isomerase